MNNEFGNGSQGDTIKGSVKTLVDQGQDTVNQIKTRVGDITGSVKETGSAAYEKTVSFVQASPFKALAVAFGLGYVLMRVRTSPLTKIAIIGGLGYLGTKGLRSSDTL